MKGRRLYITAEVFRPWSNIRAVLILLVIISSYLVMSSLGRSGADHDASTVVASRRVKIGGAKPSGAAE